MEWIQAIILGILQGLTEFLPISSTGHLFLGRIIFGLEEAGLFLDTMLHIGTLIAVMVVYKDELLSMIKKPFSKLSFLLILGTIPAVVIGLLCKDFFEEISVSGRTIGWEFLATGVVLWFADSIKKGAKKMNDITYGDALFIGVFQGMAILPAISRSGLTIAASLFRKLDRETAAYFSFLLSIPAISGAIVLQSFELVSGIKTPEVSYTFLLIATMASAVSGYIAVRWMIHYLQKGSLKIFAIYVWILGCIVLYFQFIPF
ncbi:undecaprenyl-diphosphate phosphatase [Caldalkalibacillus mannanilyticus]|uniref:undecaprenyl-diphosphate phosphatase n=1 Tax=Caldalkalibacillus mannanilyticus TaxID=1418 RepID=UPI000469D391|nr:undecaprenyl-diphosphate phosphatase [Caldalkalibacillus mannanilyticus]